MVNICIFFKYWWCTFGRDHICCIHIQPEKKGYHGPLLENSIHTMVQHVRTVQLVHASPPIHSVMHYMLRAWACRAGQLQ